MLTGQDLIKLNRGVETIYKQFSDGGTLTLRITSNTTILESFGFKEGFIDVDLKTSIDLESIRDFNLATEPVALSPLYEKMKPLLVSLFYISK